MTVMYFTDVGNTSVKTAPFILFLGSYGSTQHQYVLDEPGARTCMHTHFSTKLSLQGTKKAKYSYLSEY
jgi:hypothetical protein